MLPSSLLSSDDGLQGAQYVRDFRVRSTPVASIESLQLTSWLCVCSGKGWAMRVDSAPERNPVQAHPGEPVYIHIVGFVHTALQRELMDALHTAGPTEHVGDLYTRDTTTGPNMSLTPRPHSTAQQSAPGSQRDTPCKPALRQDKLRSLQQRRSASRSALQSQHRPLGQENVPMQVQGDGSSGGKAGCSSSLLADMHARSMDEDTLEEAMARACAVLRRSSALTEAAVAPAPVQRGVPAKASTCI